MTTEKAVATIRELSGDRAVVTTMSALGMWGEPRGRDFRLLGLMGAAASIGLGIAVGRPELDVWVVDGDGSLAMQLGVLTAVADAGPRRLTHVVIDNRVYSISGGQPTPAAETLDWGAMAAAAGYRSVATCASAEELRSALLAAGDGPRMVVVSCAGERAPFPEGAFKADVSGDAERVRSALGGSAGG